MTPTTHLGLSLVIGTILAAVVAQGESMPDLHPSLSSVATAKTLKLTTTGRKSGQPRTVEIWFVAEGDHLFVQAGVQARKGWLVNVRANPEVTLRIGTVELRGQAHVITDPAEAQRVLSLVRQKYWSARVAGWFGSQIGSGVPVRIDVARPEGAQFNSPGQRPGTSGVAERKP